MQTLNCVIIDDEPIARDILKDYILRDDRLLLLRDYSNASDALREFSKLKPHLIFLDIKMPKISGFEMLRSLPQHPQVIFTTAYREYAVESFDLNAADYLLKPFAFERFLQAVNKACMLITPAISTDPVFPAEEQPAAKDFFVKSSGKFIRIHTDDIFYIEALKEYVRIYTVSGNLVVYQTMQNLEERLPRDYFFRIHRSYIVNLQQVQAIEGNMALVYGTQLPISRYSKEEFINRVAKNKLL